MGFTQDPVSITDPKDPRIAPYRDLRDRDLVGHGERFIAEGEVVLRVLLAQQRFAVESILLSETRAEALRDALAGITDPPPVYVASRDVMDAIVGFPIHRGVLALGRRLPPPELHDFLASLPEKALVVGLVGVANHDNVGGIFRNAAAFGADAVLLDSTTCDPLYRKAIRVSVGGALVVPYLRVDIAVDMVRALRETGFETVSLSPSAPETLTHFQRAARTAILLGAEGPGLPRDLLASTRSLSIPMARGFDSLNVATTSGIVLHHLSLPDS
jgi:tRNA G18 (ribose-2'-O)-methylase SpoU